MGVGVERYGPGVHDGVAPLYEALILAHAFAAGDVGHRSFTMEDSIGGVLPAEEEGKDGEGPFVRWWGRVGRA